MHSLDFICVCTSAVLPSIDADLFFFTENQMQMQNEKAKLQRKQEELVQGYQRQVEEITKKLEEERRQKEELQRRIHSLEEDGLREKGKIEVL